MLTNTPHPNSLIRTFAPSLVRKLVAAIVFQSILLAATTGIRADFGESIFLNTTVDAPAAVSSFARLDTSFNATGVRFDAFGLATNEIVAAAIQPDGKILIAGTTIVPTGISTTWGQIMGGDLIV